MEAVLSVKPCTCPSHVAFSWKHVELRFKRLQNMVAGRKGVVALYWRRSQTAAFFLPSECEHISEIGTCNNSERKFAQIRRVGLHFEITIGILSIPKRDPQPGRESSDTENFKERVKADFNPVVWVHSVNRIAYVRRNAINNDQNGKK